MSDLRPTAKNNVAVADRGVALAKRGLIS